jgi:hypothetical protein
MTAKVGFDDLTANGAGAAEVEALPHVEAWPRLDPAALQGLAGRAVEAIDPFSEADPVGTLAHLLVAVGNAIGPGPHCQVLHDRHPARLYAAIVGESGTGRKGLAWSAPRHLLEQAAPDWVARCVHSGLSSGEGLIAHVRDPRREQQPIREHGQVTGYQEVIVDHGAEDKRALVIEAELATVLKRMAGEGNSLSAVLRDAWDDRTLGTLTKHSPLRATGTHVSVIGHITSQELRLSLTETERANGFGNRWLYVLARRSKCLPTAEPIPATILAPLIRELEDVLRFAESLGRVARNAEAEALWAEVYPALSTREPGMVGAICGRAEAQVLRLSLLYAILDCSPTIHRHHLKAALALFDYCAASARRIFGGRLGFTILDTILDALRARGSMTMDEIYNLFGRHRKKSEIETALLLLEQDGKVRRFVEKTGGRDRQVWEFVR